MKAHILTLLLFVLFSFNYETFAAKTTRVKLTGSQKEKILMKVGNTGREEVIVSLPYEFIVPKDQLPITLTFQSDNYTYYSITVPKKPVDDTGHVYLIKVDESEPSYAMYASRPQETDTDKESKVKGIDVTHGVNAAPFSGMKSPKTYALIIANENYEYAGTVDNALNDALAFKEYCIKTFGIPATNIKFHTDLSFGKMRKALNDYMDIAAMVGNESNLIIYYAGHGIPDNKTKDAFLMPVDADGTDTSICFALSDFYQQLNSVDVSQCIVFLDACFSGAKRDGDMLVAARGVKIAPEEAEPMGKTIVFTATSGDEAAFSHEQEEHGLFTYYLLKKLQETKGKVSLGELADYISDKVSLQSRLVNEKAQTPTVLVGPGIESQWKESRLAK